MEWMESKGGTFSMKMGKMNNTNTEMISKQKFEKIAWIFLDFEQELYSTFIKILLS